MYIAGQTWILIVINGRKTNVTGAFNRMRGPVLVLGPELPLNVISFPLPPASSCQKHTVCSALFLLFTIDKLHSFIIDHTL